MLSPCLQPWQICSSSSAWWLACNCITYQVSLRLSEAIVGGYYQQVATAKRRQTCYLKVQLKMVNSRTSYSEQYSMYKRRYPRPFLSIEAVNNWPWTLSLRILKVRWILVSHAVLKPSMVNALCYEACQDMLINGRTTTPYVQICLRPSGEELPLRVSAPWHPGARGPEVLRFPTQALAC